MYWDRLAAQHYTVAWLLHVYACTYRASLYWLKTCLCIQSLQNSSFNHFSAIYCLLLERVMKRQALQQNKLGTGWLKVPGHNPSATMLPLEDDLSTLEYTCSASASCQLETTGYQKSQPGDLKKREEDDQSTINPSVGFRKSQRHTPSNACASQNFSCLPSKFEGLQIFHSLWLVNLYWLKVLWHIAIKVLQSVSDSSLLVFPVPCFRYSHRSCRRCHLKLLPQVHPLCFY